MFVLSQSLSDTLIQKGETDIQEEVESMIISIRYLLVPVRGWWKILQHILHTVAS